MDADIGRFQQEMRRTYYERDAARGTAQTIAWLVEEIGELSRAVRKADREGMLEEFGDVLAWVASLANLLDVDLAEAMGKYANGCPKCQCTPCRCP